ncbi:pilus assembly protein CpaC [Comamonas sp. BIGb0152]|uniref:type II and III secretion system protein family protein n=1 Tax=Comamonas sp. BIGb0152 TaxID=2940601 RepID=UPI00216A41FA|nr:pilus assembly protein N-terminal domain-containing protein [Comamonas sp. BIGb0152]MCS4295468.1 pilus assembly protein CpaC [Comamonas sp. BIGb0152]
MRTPALASAACLPLLACSLAVQAQAPAQVLAPAAGTAQPLALVQGQQQLFKPGIAIARIAIGDPAVLDVQVLGELPQTGRPAAKASAARPARAAELLLTPKAAGGTTLMVWPSQGEPQTWNVVVSGPRLLLERRLRSLPAHAQALNELALTAPKGTPLADRSQVDVRSNTVQVDVQVVEFKKSAMRRAGVQLNSGGANDHGFQFGVYTPGSNGSSSGGSSGSGNGGSDGGTTAIASAMNLVLGFGRAFSGRGITAQLVFLEGNGLARVLAKPTLVAHSGQTASFLAGGEIPIPVPSGGSNNISIQYKEFGVKLQLTPTILSNERIALKVAPEASDLDYTQGVTINDISVPALRTRRADTFVELADGESFVIGGLVSRSTLSNVKKVPLLGDLPILGTFFKNLDYSQEETELVIIVTPRLVQPLPAGTNLEALLPGAQQELPNAGRVWAPYAVGAPYADSPLPGFSY